MKGDVSVCFRLLAFARVCLRLLAFPRPRLHALVNDYLNLFKCI